MVTLRCRHAAVAHHSIEKGRGDADICRRLDAREAARRKRRRENVNRLGHATRHGSSHASGQASQEAEGRSQALPASLTPVAVGR
jgi:hypothetical protein